MDKPAPALSFRLMSFLFLVRDLVRPRRVILNEAGIRPGSRVLDYGCGPGSCTIAAAELAGVEGKVYALDIHPLALQSVWKRSSARGLQNIDTILSDCRTGLADESVDAVLLYDVFHGLGDPAAVLRELYRVLRPDAVLSFSDHHMKDPEILAALTREGLFRPGKRGKHTITFIKERKR